MPNWCNNTVSITHKDPAKMYAIVEAINAGKFCNFAIPVPTDLQIVAGRVGDDSSPDQIALVEAEKSNITKYGHANWYDFCVAKWGTKWDVDAYEPVEFDDAHERGITFGFDSAWSPPIGVYEALVEQGYSVTAFYYEPGMAFCGKWSDEDGDEYFEISGMKSEEVREMLPEDLDDCMGISENMAEWEDMEEEENED